MPDKQIGELYITLALILRPEERAATFVGNELPHTTRLREKCAPWFAEYGREVHGHPIKLTSRWNAHDGSIGFLVSVCEEAQVDRFDFAEFEEWLLRKRDVALGEASKCSASIGGNDQHQEDVALAIGNGTMVASNSNDYAEPKRDPNPPVSTSHDLVTDFAGTDAHPETLKTHFVPGVVHAPANPVRSLRSFELPEALINQLISLARQAQVADQYKYMDIVESITPAVVIATNHGRFLVEECHLPAGVKVGASLDQFDCQPTGETATRVCTLWRSPELMIALARKEDEVETGVAAQHSGDEIDQS